MKTLIELYDERAIENVIGPEVFKPERVIYLCPAELTEDVKARRCITDFLERRGMNVSTEFISSSLYKTDKILRQLKKITETGEDYAIDVTGGTDAALFAAGMFCSESGVPAFTYSRKRNSFYDICNAPFADNLPCELQYSVEDFFSMAGGIMRSGRVDNGILADYMDTFEPFLRVYMKFRKIWTDQITFFQRISQTAKNEPVPLGVCGACVQKGERGSRVRADRKLLYELQRIGYISNLSFGDNDTVSFAFKDLQTRYWLRDIGSVLELYMYKACRDAGIFNDVVSSAVVDWDDVGGHGKVCNEIDVVASRGVVPLFISCKTCEIKTEALNELSVLTERFGGKGAKAAIVTTEMCNAAARHRAAQLGITVIDLEELKSGRVADRLKVIMKVLESI